MICKLIVLVLSISLAYSQVPTFASTPVASSTSVVTISTASSVYGTLVTLSAAGWVISSDVSGGAAASATVTFVATPLKMSGTTSIGLAVISGSPFIPSAAAGTAAAQTPCTSTSVFTSSKSTLTGGTTTSATCPSDFASIFSATTSASTSATTLASTKLVVNVPVSVTYTVPATGASGQSTIAYTLPGAASAASVTYNSASNTNTDVNQVLRGAASNPPVFGFYIQADAAAIMCLQTSATFLTNPGCGLLSNKSSSAGILSVIIAPLLFVSALILN